MKLKRTDIEQNREDFEVETSIRKLGYFLISIAHMMTYVLYPVMAFMLVVYVFNSIDIADNCKKTEPVSSYESDDDFGKRLMGALDDSQPQTAECIWIAPNMTVDVNSIRYDSSTDTYSYNTKPMGEDELPHYYAVHYRSGGSSYGYKKFVIIIEKKVDSEGNETLPLDEYGNTITQNMKIRNWVEVNNRVYGDNSYYDEY